MTFSISTTDSGATRQLGQTIGRLLQGGEMIELRSDIGGGKTTLVQGIARGMGYTGEVSSPTFTLNRVYPALNNLSLYHFDLYRLHGHDIVTDEMDEVLSDPHAVVAVEWAEQGESKLPKDRLQIELMPGEDENVRHIAVKANGPSSARITEGLSL